MQLYLCIISFIVGICLGSFYNVCIFRYIKGESIVSPSSHCPKCGHVLSWWENIPLISYILLKGHCRKCKEKISLKYFVVELISGIWSLLLMIKYGLSIPYFIYLGFGGIFIILSFIDLDIYILPDELTLTGSIVALMAAPLIGVDFLYSISGAIFGAGMFFLIQKTYKILKNKEGLGTGDIKLMFLLGALLGIEAMPFIIFVGSVVGLIGGILFLKIKGQDTQNPIPFGPFLCFSTMLYILIGKEVMSLYYQ